MIRFDLSIAKKHIKKTEFNLLRDGKNSKRLRDIKIFPYANIGCFFFLFVWGRLAGAALFTIRLEMFLSASSTRVKCNFLL